MEWLEMIRIATPLLAVGGAFGGAKVALNGTRARVMKLEDRSDNHDVEFKEINRTLTRVETKQDMLMDYLKESK
jgi:hypothetical protein